MSLELGDIVAKLQSRGDTTGYALTQRELQVLRLSCKGLESKTIAHQLGTAVSTVNNIRSNVMQKLGAKNGVQLGWLAHSRGLV